MNPFLANAASSNPFPISASDTEISKPPLLPRPTPALTISGTVTLSGGGTLDGVTVTLTGDQSDTTTTSGGGNYSFSVSSGDYSVAFSKAGYSFNPASQENRGMVSNWTLDSVATLMPYTVSDIIKESGNPLTGVTVTISGDQSGSVVSDGTGTYSFFTNGGDNVTITPTKTNYIFSPTSKNFPSISKSEVQDFSATYQTTSTISGYIKTADSSGVAGVTVTLSGDQSATYVTDTDGFYTFDVIDSSSVAVTPTLTNYSFTPPSASRKMRMISTGL